MGANGRQADGDVWASSDFKTRMDGSALYKENINVYRFVTVA